MKYYLILALLINVLYLTAQQKGVSPLSPTPSGGGRGATYAVVVGISDYHDPAKLRR